MDLYSKNLSRKNSDEKFLQQIFEYKHQPKNFWRNVSTKKDLKRNLYKKKSSGRKFSTQKTRRQISTQKIWRNDSTKKIWEGISTKNYLERKSLPTNHEDKSLPNKNSEEKLFTNEEWKWNTQKHLSQKGLYQKLLQETAYFCFFPER